MQNINYQHIYENEVTHTLIESLELPGRFSELPHQHRLIIEELVEAGYRRAVQDALDPEILSETVALAAEMGGQLYNFANMITAQFAPDDDTSHE
jgi:hypothetical protein